MQRAELRVRESQSCLSLVEAAWLRYEIENRLRAVYLILSSFSTEETGFQAFCNDPCRSYDSGVHSWRKHSALLSSYRDFQGLRPSPPTLLLSEESTVPPPKTFPSWGSLLEVRTLHLLRSSAPSPVQQVKPMRRYSDLSSSLDKPARLTIRVLWFLCLIICQIRS